MKEVFVSKAQNELTPRGKTTYAGANTIFMGEGSSAVAERPAAKTTQINQKPEGSNQPLLSLPERRALADVAWRNHYEQLGKKMQTLSFEERQTLKHLIDRGIVPQGEGSALDYKTSKGEKNQTAREVFSNAGGLEQSKSIEWAQELFKRGGFQDLKPEEQKILMASHHKRLELAKKLLGKDKLTESEMMAILEAHYTGTGEKGKDDENEAGAFNYRAKHIMRKSKILRDAGFSPEARRVLMEAGIAAAPIAVPGGDPRLARVAEEYNDMAAQAITRMMDRYVRDNPGAAPGDPDYDEALAQAQAKALPSEDVEKLIDQARGLRDRGADAGAARSLLGDLRGRFNDAREEENDSRRREYTRRPDGLWQTISADDFRLLQEGSADSRRWDEFINKWFDSFYRAAEGKDPTVSGDLDQVQNAYQEAKRYLTTNLPNAEGVRYLAEIFDTRIHLLTFNSAISSKSIESIAKGVYGLRAHGLMAGANLGEGYTGAMFNRITELLEDLRLQEANGHMTPELANTIQQRVINESIELARAGVGLHGSLGVMRDQATGDRLVGPDGRFVVDEASIVRAVRSGFDITVGSQRMHILASRGKELYGTDAFFSDAGAAFKAFNIETFVSEKWGMLTPTDERFFIEVVQHSLVEQWLEDRKKQGYSYNLDSQQSEELGHILFKVMGSPPDFFSSGWRIKGMKNQLQDHLTYRVYLADAQEMQRSGTLPANIDAAKDPRSYNKAEWDVLKQHLRAIRPDRINELVRTGKERAEELGLFLRVKGASNKPDEEGREERAEIWEKIAQYKPEEVVRLLREKWTPAELRTMNREMFGGDGSYGYDQFKEEFGPVMRALREQGLRGELDPQGLPQQINFSALTVPQRVAFENYLEALHPGEGLRIANEAIERVNQMKRYLTRNNIAYTGAGHDARTKNTVFEKDYRFADLYNKTIDVSDILMGELEGISDSERAFGVLEVSKKFSSDLGGDGLVRNINDLVSSHAYADGIVAAARATDLEEKLKNADEAAVKVADYNGREGEAQVLMSVHVASMKASMPPGLWEALGINETIMRQKISKMQEIYGPHAKLMLQEERRHEFDKIEARIAASVQNEINEHKAKILELQAELDNLDPADPHSAERRIELQAEIREHGHGIHEAEEKGEKYKEYAEKYLDIRGGDLARGGIIKAIANLILSSTAEGVKVALLGKA